MDGGFRRWRYVVEVDERGLRMRDVVEMNKWIFNG